MDKKWKLINSKPVFESKYLQVEDRTYELPDGKIGEHYYHVSRPDYVLILAINDKEQIVVERQYRRGVDDFVYELPAGWIDEGETPLQAAIRELKEETGFEGKGEIWQEIYPEPAFMSMKAFVVILEFEEKVSSQTEHGHDEHLKFELMEIPGVKKMVEEGKIKDMGFLAAMEIFDNYKV